MKFAAIIFAIFCASTAAFAQDEPIGPPVIETVYLAKDDGEGRAGDEVTEFGVNDVPIHCVILLDRNGKMTVKMNFVAVKVAGVRPETKVVSSSYTTSERQNRINFTGQPDGRWVPGSYRVDIFVDGKPARKVEFEIKGTAAAAGANGAAKSFQAPRPPKKKPF